MAPSLCGEYVTSKRSLLALGWTLTSVLSFAAFVVAALYAVQIRSHYYYVAQTYGYSDDDTYSRGDGCDGENGEGGEGCNYHDSRDDKASYYYGLLASVSSGSMTFAGIYTATVAVGLSLYGSLAIVGFSSVKGTYIAPCLGDGISEIQPRIHLGIFMGALVIFSNLCLVCAVIFGEFRVEDYKRDDMEEVELDSYAVERVSAALAVLCMFLAVLYFSYAILLFVFKDDLLDDGTDGVKKMELGGMGSDRYHHRAAMEDSSRSIRSTDEDYQPPSRVGKRVSKTILPDSTAFTTTQGTESF